ncbi:MAG: methionine adenosyltransferase [Bacteroidetes Order II. Incertae sedis bacterium]|jgi:S-adenosylmethionine synthetase|nr:methionine adenosyltransferase [Bacteroidetes Order II. bacterium]MDG1754574.1 methionine adenosyltransferase [Rhodothermales bacterium]HAY36078.1 methionine adenosyltransferase [Bacteroidota bacterium]MBT4601736.1 methionine adenosyltransferase [Bacteroidetes Order II. bacterium]MBT5249427.1 methionine adenosyltransferase [Bacteroidetes Order II. bacterium]
MSFLFTSESVSEGHPDKVSDQISDAILDAMLAQDPNSRVAVETLVTTGLVILSGEVTTEAYIDVQEVARGVIRKIGYTDPLLRFDADSCGVLATIHEQSADIAQGVDDDKGMHVEQGAGDQGMMFGYASRETDELMPMALSYSHALVRELASIRKNDTTMPYLRPDSKSQVTVEYEDDGKTIKRVHTVVVSTQHGPDVEVSQIKQDVITHLLPRVIPAHLMDDEMILHVNPTGQFIIGGPHGDTGLTGRKIIVDTYGGKGAHGGGAFSGKDPSKVDRSAAYAARYVAKNLVASGLAEEALVQLAYAIGVADPVSIHVDSYGTGQIPDHRLVEIVRQVFDLTPRGIISGLDLKRPIYQPTAAYGHFGRSEFSWEALNKVEDIVQAAKLLS